jgi:hypothetical protein
MKTRLEQLHDLRDALKKATGPEQRLDRAIHDLFRIHAFFPSYTASIDAAMGLVPKGWGYFVLLYPEAGFARAELPSCSGLHEPGVKPHTSHVAATPALALCLACVEYAIAKEITSQC